MSMPRIILKQKLCMLLFAAGIVISLICDLAGIGAVAPGLVFDSSVKIPVPDYIIVPAVYAAASVIVGLATKRRWNAPIYGACLGQAQLLLPIILFFVLHQGNAFDIFWRSMCGLPLTACISGAAYSVKQLVKGSTKNNDRQ